MRGYRNENKKVMREERREGKGREGKGREGKGREGEKKLRENE